jgi:uncharacterized protein YsxB (DUF464 family)
VISVKILRNSASRIVGFEVSGHANYAEYGQDIVCAAVSALCIAIANGLERHCRAPVSIETSDGYMRVVSELTERGEIDNSSGVLYDTLVDALRGISEQYPGRISIVTDCVSS